MDGLTELVVKIEEAFDTEDYVTVRKLIAEDMLAAWFGMGIDRFVSVLGKSISHQPSLNDVASVFFEFITSLSDNTEPFQETVFPPNQQPEHALLREFTSLYALRLQGRAKEALDIAGSSKHNVNKLYPLFEKHSAWPMFNSLQYAITALLSGEFKTASAKFTEAHMRELPEMYSFLRRDVFSKAALLHATFGDPAEAKRLLEKSSKVARSSSWLEDTLDAQDDLVIAALSEDPAEALNKLQAIDLHSIGEMWPFYISISQRVYNRSGRAMMGDQLISTMREMPFPRFDGQGYSGSVFESILAVNAAAAGDLNRARKELSMADPDFSLTMLANGLIELHSGNARKALDVALNLRDRVSGLRQLEIWRVGLMTGALFNLGELSDCKVALNHLFDHFPDLHSDETIGFCPEVAKFAHEKILGWPSPSKIQSTIVYSGQNNVKQLSERELLVLQCLANNMTRSEVSEKLYISLNTVKTQISSIYKKLGVSSRSAALLTAERRGLLT